ncbi:MAG TPA: DNA-3-methyladenine glycosylase [Candidatus Paceibacterota bacterium]|nr:DNA-3-methyladenine glycosylase [Candidatus Paceibacterota bacterium]
MAAKDFDASLAYLKKDPYLKGVIRAIGKIEHRRKHSGNLFRALSESIIYQQLSGKAAATILKRFIALWPGKPFPTPEEVKKIPIAKLRSAGLSGQKSAYLKDLAARCIDGTVSSRAFHRMSDEQIINHLVAVKGIGRWTAQMFLMFTLGRADVLPTGDLAIQKGFQRVFGLKKLPSEKQMEKLSQSWAGHRTMACFYLWRLLDQK